MLIAHLWFGSAESRHTPISVWAIDHVAPFQTSPPFLLSCAAELYRLVDIVVPSFRPDCTVHVIHFEKELLRQAAEQLIAEVMPEFLT